MTQGKKTQSNKVMPALGEAQRNARQQLSDPGGVVDAAPPNEVNARTTTGTDLRQWWHAVTGPTELHQQEVREASQMWFSSEESRKGQERFLDKLTFTLSVAGTIIVAICVSNAKARAFAPYCYCVSFPILIIIRYVQYSKRKWQYFLLDFCYMANLCLALYFLIFPHSGLGFAVIHGISHGPLPWTVVAYRNSLVFHSIDRYTSFYIHVMPMAMTYAVRWYPEDCSRLWYTDLRVDPHMETLAPDMAPTQALFLLFVVSTCGCFLVQIVIEMWIVEWLAAQPCCSPFLRVAKDQEYLTLFRYSRGADNFISRIINACGKRHQLKMWLLNNVVYTFITSLPLYLWFESQTADAGFGSVIFLWGTWNGANFYIEVFAAKYDAKRTSITEKGTVELSKEEYSLLLENHRRMTEYFTNQDDAGMEKPLPQGGSTFTLGNDALVPSTLRPKSDAGRSNSITPAPRK